MKLVSYYKELNEYFSLVVSDINVALYY